MQVGLDKFPDCCPLCHRSITPIDSGFGYHKGQNTSALVERILRCPSDECQRLFVARYVRTKNPSSTHFELYESVPTDLTDAECSKIISDISPDYCKIYDQAHKAEQVKLDLIAGPGYRKALEFLIKDYLLQTHSDEKEKENIQKMLLGKCISTYVTNDRIKQTASRAAWVGNDETHFVRKWEDKDLKDLKVLIGLTVRWIEMEKMTEEAIGGMLSSII